MNVGVDRKACRRKKAVEGGNIVAIEADPGGKAQPSRHATVVIPTAVVINQALAPRPPYRRIIAARDERGIFDRNHRLVVVAIQRPCLHLPLGAKAGVKH